MLEVGEHYYFNRSYENELGSGGFGVVYKGYDKRNPDNVVAVKEVREANLNMTNVERENEIIMLLQSINHENIVRHYHTDRKDKYIFIVMELCNYSDLESYYKKHAPLNISDMNIILKQLASGLQLLYSKKIIHRDLKPMNILLHNNNNVEDPLINDLTLKIADFGLSRFISSKTLATTSVGTLIYMAPEIYTQEKYDHRADVWSVGVIVYRGLFGSLPEFLNRDNFLYFNFWIKLHKQNKEPKIKFPFCESLNLIQLLRKSLIRDVASRMNMLNFLNSFSISLEKPGNNRNLIIVKHLHHKALNSDPSLLSAARKNNIDLVRTLLEQCADSNIKDKYGSTALHLAALNKDDNYLLVELLLEYGADIDSQDKDDSTCLMHAARNNNIEIVRCLLQNGADINKKDNEGANVLQYAVENKNDNKFIIELLLEYGADINGQDKDGSTCLMYAASNDNIEIVRYLLQNGANINKQNRFGQTAIQIARSYGKDNKEVIELLLDYERENLKLLNKNIQINERKKVTKKSLKNRKQRNTTTIIQMYNHHHNRPKAPLSQPTPQPAPPLPPPTATTGITNAGTVPRFSNNFEVQHLAATKKEKNNKKKKDKKPKIRKEDIGNPTNFQHISHISWNKDHGFSQQLFHPEPMDKSLLKAANIQNPDEIKLDDIKLTNMVPKPPRQDFNSINSCEVPQDFDNDEKVGVNIDADTLIHQVADLEINEEDEIIPDSEKEKEAAEPMEI